MGKRCIVMLFFFRFTLSVWLYIIEYCPNQKHRLCSVVQRISWDDVYLTPIVFINRKGNSTLKLCAVFIMYNVLWQLLVYCTYLDFGV